MKLNEPFYAAITDDSNKHILHSHEGAIISNTISGVKSELKTWKFIDFPRYKIVKVILVDAQKMGEEL